MRHAMIMAGGSGTRLWPLSRRARPKQLLELLPGGRSLLEEAVDRLHGVVDPARRLICTGERFRAAIEGAIPGVEVLGEPCARDTLNAVGLTAAVLAARDPEAIFAVLTADHLIKPQAEFERALDLGFTLVEEDRHRLVTFGIRPTHPATGYGYIGHGVEVSGHPGAFAAASFKEKPDLDIARAWVDAGTFSWNSGMFVFSAKTVLQAIELFHPATATALATIGAAFADENNNDQRAAVLERLYPDLHKTSVDYGLLEPAAASGIYSVCMVPMDVAWRDIGSWPSYAETLDADHAGNRLRGKAILKGCDNVMVVSDDDARLVTAIGCSDLLIVATNDAILVCPRDQAESVKDVANSVPENLK